MKKYYKLQIKLRISTLIILNLYATVVFSQHEWAPIGATWYYNNPGPNGESNYSYTKYTCEKDTIVNDKICRLISSNAHKEVMWEENGVVYYWYDEKFRPIYNYTANVGDEVCFEFKAYGISTGSLKVDSVYNLKGNVLSVEQEIMSNIKTYQVEINTPSEIDPFVYVYSERIGYAGKFIFTLRLYETTGGYSTSLRCYNDDILSYKAHLYDYPCDHTELTDLELQNDSYIKTHPNPCNGYLKICIEPYFSTNFYHVKIVDINGKIINSVDITNASQSIETNNLAPGVYLCNYYENDKYFGNFKFIKQ